MKTWQRDTITSILAIIVFAILTGLIYPLAITGISQVAFPGDANGQQIHLDGKLVGSKIIGQSFARPVIGKNGKPEEKEEELVTEPEPRYFQSRPSATEGGAYNAAASTFSNHGPNSVKTKEADEENIKAYLEMNTNPSTKKEYDIGLTAARIPVDAVNSSGSGLDPEISKANAWIQAYRVAAVRRLPRSTVDGLISKYTSGRGLGFSGEEGVNVLELNLALDRMTEGTG
jgi:potassium-transporting ATPase KdpC subunit